MTRRIAIAIVVAVTACNDEDTTSPPVVDEGAVEEVAVEPAFASVAVGEALVLSALVVGPDGYEVPDVDVTWSARQPEIAAVSEGGEVEGVAPGSTWIVAEAEEVRDSAEVHVASEGGNIGRNEPAHHELIASHTLDCMPGSGCAGEVGHWWARSSDVDAGRMYLVDDGLEILFPAGWQDGSSPARFDGWSSSGSGRDEYESVYVRMQVRLVGPDWENQSVLTKHFYLAYGSDTRQNHGFFGQSHSGGQAVRSAFHLMPWLSEVNANGVMPTGGAARRPANVESGDLFTAGEWHEIEVLLELNDPNGADGRVRLWIDGVQTHDVGGLRLRGAADPMGVHWFQFTPVYGGVSGDVKTRDDRMRLRDIYISGAN